MATHTAAKIISCAFALLTLTSDATATGSARTRDTACIYKNTSPPTKNPEILIPLYTGGDLPLALDGACAHHMYVDVARGCRSVTAIINPNNGPFASDSPRASALKTCMKMLDANGVTMVGYVSTKIASRNPDTGVWSTTGMRSVSLIDADMNSWVALTCGMKNFKGFFLDGTTNYYQTLHKAFGIDHVSWYRQLVNLAKAKIAHALIVLNPGSFVDLKLVTTDPAGGYPEAAEISVAFEDYAEHWRPKDNNCSVFKNDLQIGQGTFGPGPWCRNIPKWDHVEPFIAAVSNRLIKVSAIVHSAPREFAFNEAKVAAENGFQYFYATDRSLLEGPWESVPKFWDEYLAFLDASESNSTCVLAGTTVGPFPIGCLKQWWILAGCTDAGEYAPKDNTRYWYNAALTAAQVNADFAAYFSLASSGLSNYKTACGI